MTLGGAVMAPATNPSTEKDPDMEKALVTIDAVKAAWEAELGLTLSHDACAWWMSDTIEAALPS